MSNWLTIVKNRCGTTLFHWQQRLPSFHALSALTALVFIGFSSGSLEPQLSSSSVASFFISNPDTGSSYYRARLNNRQKNVLAKVSPPVSSTAQSTTSSELFPPLPNTYDTDVESSPNLGVTLTPRFPENLANLNSEERKKLFIDLLLPTVMIALEEVKQERQQLLTIVAELGARSPDFLFSKNDLVWQHQIGANKAKFILGLTQKYRTENVTKLLAQINVLPPSLIIAQSAIESGWGSSRFATEVNNLFGMYSSIRCSATSDEDAVSQPKIIKYESILDSVRSYVLNINRLSAYKELRQIRNKTLDPMRIAEGLTQYSERKEYYIADVKHIITYNNLQYFDTFILDAV